MLGAALIGLATAAALLAAASFRLRSLVSTLLAAYLAFVVALVLPVLALSPFREVTRSGLAAAEALLLAAALAAWLLRGRPGLPLGDARFAVRRVAGDPVSAVFVAVAAVLLAYELLLVFTVPPNNTDSLLYHLPRAAAWAQHHGVYWVPNAPVPRINEFPPLAEQQILFLFVATAKGALFALPQFLAELAILVSVYGSARRLGFEARAAACAACLVATFSLFALEATTAQNDLVAASFTAVSACLILGGGPVELVLAGVAVSLGLATKLTTVLVWPVLLVLLLRRGWRAIVPAAAGGLAAFVLVAMWGFVLNQEHTGHLRGHGSDLAELKASPAWPESLHTALHVLYRTFDLSVISYRTVHLLAAAGVAAAAAGAVYGYRRADLRHLALALALPLFLMLLAFQSLWNPWLTRFLLVPAALTAPLLAGWFRWRPAAVSAVAVATLLGVLVLVHDVRKPFASPVGRPWELSWLGALSSKEGSGFAPTLAAYRRLVPPRACVGAVLGPDDSSFPLYGPTLEHRIVYLPVDDAVLQAYRNHLFYVVVSTGPNRWAAGEFTKEGWTQRQAGSLLLLVSPAAGAKTGDCRFAA